MVITSSLEIRPAACITEVPDKGVLTRLSGEVRVLGSSVGGTVGKEADVSVPDPGTVKATTGVTLDGEGW